MIALFATVFPNVGPIVWKLLCRRRTSAFSACSACARSARERVGRDLERLPVGELLAADLLDLRLAEADRIERVANALVVVFWLSRR